MVWTLHTNAFLCMCNCSMCTLSSYVFSYRIRRQKLLRRIRCEIDTLSALDGCVSAIQFEGAYETDQFVYLVMNVCHGGDLETLFKVCMPCESLLALDVKHWIYSMQQPLICTPFMQSHHWPCSTLKVSIMGVGRYHVL